jgi:hypothetical protein
MKTNLDSGCEESHPIVHLVVVLCLDEKLSRVLAILMIHFESMLSFWPDLDSCIIREWHVALHLGGLGNAERGKRQRPKLH